MTRSYFSSPEPLEQRIAPAGLVTTTFAGGVLTISGADGQDHNVEIVKTGKNRFSVEGTGTDIDELGQSSKSFRGALKVINIEGGTGEDSFSLTNLQPVKTLNVNGGDGVDSLTTTNYKSTKGGKVEISLGSEDGKVDFGGDRTIIRGDLTLAMGGGGEVNLASVLTKIRGNAVITGRAS
jgi:hypothetical protein